MGVQEKPKRKNQDQNDQNTVVTSKISLRLFNLFNEIIPVILDLHSCLASFMNNQLDGIPNMSGMSRSELLDRLRALKLERANNGSSSSGSHDSSTDTEMKNDSDHKSSGGQSNGQHGEGDVTKMGMPAMLKSLRRKRKEEMHATKMATLKEMTNSERLAEYFTATDLEKKIIRQVEYYFGDHNLPRDRFMNRVMSDNDGWIPMETMMTFKRLASLSKDPDHVMTALEKSTNKVVQVDLDARQIRRDPANPLPNMTQGESKMELQERTVFVGGFDRDATTLDDLLEFFEGKFDKVVNIRMRFGQNPTVIKARMDNPDRDDRQFLGSVWVTFETLQAAKAFLDLAASEPGLALLGHKISAKPQREFLDTRHEDNDEFNLDKIYRTVFVQGFDKTDMTDDELVDFFVMFDGAETVKKRVCRDNSSKDRNEGIWRFSGSVFVTFETVETALAFFQSHSTAYGKLPLTYKGDKLTIKWQKDFYQAKGKFRSQMRMLEEEVPAM